MSLSYEEILHVKEDADFDKLAHFGHNVKFVLAPLLRKKEFMDSEGYKALYPLSEGKILYYV